MKSLVVLLISLLLSVKADYTFKQSPGDPNIFIVDVDRYLGLENLDAEGVRVCATRNMSMEFTSPGLFGCRKNTKTQPPTKTENVNIAREKTQEEKLIQAINDLKASHRQHMQDLETRLNKTKELLEERNHAFEVMTKTHENYKTNLSRQIKNEVDNLTNVYGQIVILQKRKDELEEIKQKNDNMLKEKQRESESCRLQLQQSQSQQNKNQQLLGEKTRSLDAMTKLHENDILKAKNRENDLTNCRIQLSNSTLRIEATNNELNGLKASLQKNVDLLKEKEKGIASFKIQLQQSQSQQNKTQLLLGEKTGSLEAMTKLHENDILNAKNRENELTNCKTQLSKSTLLLEVTNNDLNDLKSSLWKNDVLLKEKEREIESFKVQLQETQSQQNKTQLLLVEKTRPLDAMANMHENDVLKAKNREVELTNCQTQLSNTTLRLDETNKKLNDLIIKNNNDIIICQSQIDELELKCTKQLAERNSTLDALKISHEKDITQILAAKNHELEDLIKSNAEQLTLANSHINDTQLLLMEKTKVITTLEEKNRDTQEFLQFVKDGLRQAKININDTNQLLNEKNRIIQDMKVFHEGQMQEKNHEIAILKNSHKQQMARMKQLLEDTNRALDIAENEMADRIK